jgi:predicted nucleic acid-binding protein
MSARFFLDTNIFVYSLDRNAPAKSRKAAQLINEALATRKGIIGYQVVQEFFSVVLKHSQITMKAADAEQYLSSVFRPLLKVHSSQAIYSEALQIHERSRLAWYDSLIVAAAIQGKCEVLYTEDLHHGQRFGNLQIVNPFL